MIAITTYTFITMFDPSTLPIKAGDLLLVTDRLAAPADFIILNILTTHLRQVNHGKTVFASISQTLSHWSSISSRLVVLIPMCFLNIRHVHVCFLEPIGESLSSHIKEFFGIPRLIDQSTRCYSEISIRND